MKPHNYFFIYGTLLTSPVFALDIIFVPEVQKLIGNTFDLSLIPQTCPLGGIWVHIKIPGQEEGFVCMQCPDGTYNDETENLVSSSTITNPVTTTHVEGCKECADLSPVYKHTCNDGVACHDEATDCYATVTFNGVGGTSEDNHATETVEAHYTSGVTPGIGVTPLTQSCKFKNEYLCTVGPSAYNVDHERINALTWTHPYATLHGWCADDIGCITELKETNNQFEKDIDLYAVWQCKAGTHKPIDSYECEVCPAGQYETSTVTGHTVQCSTCPTEFPHTWSEAKPENHDAKTDCLIKITFKGDGGNYINRQGTSTEDAPVGAHYRNSDSFSDTCELNYKAKSTDTNLTKKHLCKSNNIETKININVTKEIWTRDGYTFAGWFTEDTLTNLVTEDKTFSGADVTLYAKWCNNDTGQVPNAKGKCVCTPGFYGEEHANCTACPKGTTTTGYGATKETDCNTAFKYGDGKYWTWPTNINPDPLVGIEIPDDTPETGE